MGFRSMGSCFMSLLVMLPCFASNALQVETFSDVHEWCRASKNDCLYITDHLKNVLMEAPYDANAHYLLSVGYFLLDNISNALYHSGMCVHLTNYSVFEYDEFYLELLRNSETDPVDIAKNVSFALHTLPHEKKLHFYMIESHITYGTISELYDSVSFAIDNIPTAYFVWARLIDVYYNVLYWNRGDHLKHKLSKESMLSTINKGLEIFPLCPALNFFIATLYHSDEYLNSAYDHYLISNLLTEYIYEDSVMSLIRNGNLIQNNMVSINARRNISRSTSINMTSMSDLSVYSTNLRNLLSRSPLQVNIGCSSPDHCAKEGWIVVNAVPTPCVHIVSLAHQLQMIKNSTVNVIYTSHMLEHLSFGQIPDSSTILFKRNISQPKKYINPWRKLEQDTMPEKIDSKCKENQFSEICQALKEWHRVLIPAVGKIYLAVPDIEILATLVNKPDVADNERDIVHAMIFGGQKDKYDYHKVGFNFSLLRSLLENSGFCNVIRLQEDMNFFKDASTMTIAKTRISLNVQATKC